ncbi:HIT family protein [Massilia sp. W12]|uniref:HIT family protein n=1 Tax=Massilia sp. W12 TaxID=3126507 RepID=UPI0030CB73B2
MSDCVLCAEDGGALIWRNAAMRVVLVDDAMHPAYCRVIWNAHVAEMSDLTPAEQEAMMRAVLLVEQQMRAVMSPHKINLASLGNMTPHLHWHIIGRWPDDVHFPQAIWGALQRDPTAANLSARRAQLPALQAAVHSALAAAFTG